ncbi:MAG TPA: type IV pilus twitching motility protein PilT [Candidatus Eremiobacteraeota bacterium]|nr:MAG: Twitching mobility protein [bacterium ADurb.Bin363]HPZ07344.1 type IV pilus twitching motility protein PilT [Candidatus Eremiobacteraeota bacterium]
MLGRIWNKDEQGKQEQIQSAVTQEQRQTKEVTKDAEVYRVPNVITTEINGKYTINDLFDIMITENISDLHILPEYPPVFRLHGDIIPSDLPCLSSEQAKALIYQSLTKDEIIKFEELGDLDSSYEAKDIARFRINVLKQNNGTGAVFRQIPIDMPTIDDLELPSVLKRFIHYRQGLILVTGPTGSGKSTTLAAIINYANRNRSAKIITIEDPLEFTHTSDKCLIIHRQVGLHARSFADALRAAMREDPDIILIGEMRDLETVSLAVTAADMGILVFATLHTNSAAKTVDRIIDVFPSEKQGQIRSMLSTSLKAVISQTLLKTIDGKSRCCAMEIMLESTGISSLIREGKISLMESLILSGRDQGMQIMDQALKDLVLSGKVSFEEAKERATEPETFLR